MVCAGTPIENVSDLPGLVAWSHSWAPPDQPEPNAVIDCEPAIAVDVTGVLSPSRTRRDTLQPVLSSTPAAAAAWA